MKRETLAALIGAMGLLHAGVLRLLLALVLVSASAAAQNDAATRSAGRKLAQDGVALLQQGQAAQASEKLEKAYQLLQVPSVALWSGRALAARGLLVEASERYVEASRLTGFKGDQQVQLDAQKDAARELESLTPRIPTLVIAVAAGTGERPTVTLDGKPVPTALWGEEQPVNPGPHEVKLVAGDKQITRQVALAEAEKKRESLSLDAEPTAESVLAPSPTSRDASGGGRRTLAVVALAAGGAGLVLGGVTGAMAMSKHGSLEDSDHCAGDVCLPDQQSDVDSLNTLRTVSTVGFIAGGVLAATGVVLLLTDKPPAATGKARAPNLALHVAPSRVLLSGTF